MTTDLITPRDEWAVIREQAGVIATSGLAPDRMTADQVAVVALKGRELGVPPMQALSHIHVIKGKPTLSAEMMRALIVRAGHRIRIVENTATRCVLQGIRRDDPDHVTEVVWDADRAKRAGLGGDNYRKFSEAMLLARATTELGRAMFADVLMGASYTPDELGAEVDYADGGATVTVVPDDDVIDAEVVDDTDEPDQEDGNPERDALIAQLRSSSSDLTPEQLHAVRAYLADRGASQLEDLTDDQLDEVAVLATSPTPADEVWA